MEKIKTVIEILNKYTQEMENYAYYGSNPGIPESEYPEIATEIVQAVMGWQPIETAPEMVHEAGVQGVDVEKVMALVDEYAEASHAERCDTIGIIGCEASKLRAQIRNLLMGKDLE